MIAREGGHVDKFEGDGLMAVFGAPESFPDHAERAVRAAIEIDRRVNLAGRGRALRARRRANTGRVVAGSVGGGGRLNFSVIGDAVNVAARVEAATRLLGDRILITSETRAGLGPVSARPRAAPISSRASSGRSSSSPRRPPAAAALARGGRGAGGARRRARSHRLAADGDRGEAAGGVGNPGASHGGRLAARALA